MIIIPKATYRGRSPFRALGGKRKEREMEGKGREGKGMEGERREGKGGRERKGREGERK